jgi:hypothetical protein
MGSTHNRYRGKITVDIVFNAPNPLEADLRLQDVADALRERFLEVEVFRLSEPHRRRSPRLLGRPRWAGFFPETEIVQIER